MQKKQVHFLGGLPRSGSTILCALLHQNPEIHATTTSGNSAVITMTRNQWHNIEPFRSLSEEETERKKLGVMRGQFYGFFADVERPIAIDKSRGWLEQLEVVCRIIHGKPRVIVPVRDVRDVLCSFEALYRETKGKRQMPFELSNPIESRTMEGRCALWSSNGGIVGMCANDIRDAVTRGWRKSMLFVEYDKMTGKPNETMREIYDFLELPPFVHSFDKVEQIGDENDLAYGWVNLHKIRSTVAPQESRWPTMMSKQMSDAYAADAFFWRHL